MNRSFIPTLFEDEMLAFRSLFGDQKSCRGAGTDVGVYEDEHAMTVEAPVPGLKAEEIRVNLKEGVLYIQGEKREEKKEAKCYSKWASKFSYSVLLPQPVEESGEIKAELKDGILTVRLPKSRASKPLKITVKGV